MMMLNNIIQLDEYRIHDQLDPAEKKSIIFAISPNWIDWRKHLLQFFLEERVDKSRIAKLYAKRCRMA